MLDLLPSNPELSETWETWDVSFGYASLAHYVSVNALNGHGLNVRHEYVARLADDVGVTRLLFEKFAGRHFMYAPGDWTPLRRGTQPIRHPGWIASEGGNCLDFSVLFAAMCLRAGVAPILVVTSNHAFVLTRPGWLRGPGRMSGAPLAVEGADFDEVEGKGVLLVDDPSGLRHEVEAERLVAIDCVSAAAGQSFPATRADALSHIDRGVRLVDIAYLQDHAGIEPLEPPLGWASVRPYPSGPIELPPLFASQQEALATLQGERAVGGKIMALIADSGFGKSTVARALLASQDNHARWFLDASDLQSLMDSLADAELAERGSDAGYLDVEPQALTAESLERPDREGFALAALDRLRRVTTPWTVVLDNADIEPSKLARFIPQPGPGQLVLVTSIKPEWSARVPDRPLELGPVAPEEVAKRVGSGDELVHLIGGRALLFGAFARLFAHGDITPADVPAAPSGSADEGAARYWAAFNRAERRDGSQLWQLTARQHDAAVLAAYLPPDRIPVGLLERLSGADGAARVLADRGLLALEGDRMHARLHRMIGAAIRDDLEHRTPADIAQIALRIAGDAEARALLSVHGDQRMATRLLVAIPKPDSDVAAQMEASLEALLGPLAGLADVLELRGDSKGCAAAYARVLELVDDRPEHREFRADGLFAQARLTNRTGRGDEKALRAGLAQAREAHEIARALKGDEHTGRFLALIGLLQKQLADYPLPGSSVAKDLHAASDTVSRAFKLREGLPLAHPERARAQFNLAGICIPLAQAEPERAVVHLETAQEHYAAVAELRRERVFRCQFHAQIAICVQGLALVAYYRAILVASTAHERSAYLRDATELMMAALEHWESIEDGQDGAECEKAAKILAKILLARSVHRSLEFKQHPERDGMRKLSGRIAPLITEAVQEMGTRYVAG